MGQVQRNQQMRAAAFAYDNASPPEPVEIDFTDADDRIAYELNRDGVVAEVVMELRNAADLLNWIAHNVNVPGRYLAEFRELDRRASGIASRAMELVEAQV